MRTTEFRHCLACGYVLEHLPEPRCPECGRVFDPGNPRTFTYRPRRGWLLSGVHAVLAAALIVGSATGGLALGTWLFHDGGPRYFSPREQWVAVACVVVLGFAVCASRRWRMGELLAGLLIAEAVIVVHVFRLTWVWGRIQAFGWDALDWWRSDLSWLFWYSKFITLPFLIPLFCRAIGWLPRPLGR